MVLGPFLFLSSSIGIGYLTGSSTDAKNQVALVTGYAVKRKPQRNRWLDLRLQDEAAAKKAIRMKQRNT